MTSKDKMKKDELIAELDKVEAERDSLKSSNEELGTTVASLKEQIQKLESDVKEAATVVSSKAGDAAMESLGKITKGEAGTSPDGCTHFHSFSASYRIPVGNKYVKFDGNRFASDDARIVSALKRHPAFGLEFWVTLEPKQEAA